MSQIFILTIGTLKKNVTMEIKKKSTEDTIPLPNENFLSLRQYMRKSKKIDQSFESRNTNEKGSCTKSQCTNIVEESQFSRKKNNDDSIYDGFGQNVRKCTEIKIEDIHKFAEDQIIAVTYKQPRESFTTKKRTSVALAGSGIIEIQLIEPSPEKTDRNDTNKCNRTKLPKEKNSEQLECLSNTDGKTNLKESSLHKRREKTKETSKTIPFTRFKYSKHTKPEKTLWQGKLVYKCTEKNCNYFHENSYATLRKHAIRHQPDHKAKWFHCDYCDYKAKWKGSLIVHMVLHRNPQDIVWYMCEICEKKFKHKNSLREHEKRHLKPDQLKQYACNQCSYKSPFKGAFERHKIKHLPPEKRKLLNCSICAYSTFNKYYLSRHSQTHRPPCYKCLLCPYTAKYKVNLEAHMTKHNPKGELFSCDFCDFKTNRKANIGRHYKKVHNANRKELFFCHNCSYKTPYKRCLVKHMPMHRKDLVNYLRTKIKTEPASGDEEDQNSCDNN